ncbi:MAG: nitroreductase family protein [Deltaproteobacteria bacterium]|nr:nitroreductase family protein [Deltaproteobacteria bacterium]
MPTAISIAAEQCKRDGLCARVCPARIYDWQKDTVPTISRVEHCGLCGQCLAVCPGGAIVHSRLDPNHFTRIENRQPVEPAAAQELLRQRRSVRNYKPDEVPRDLLEQIARVAAYAPTSAHGGEGWVRSATIVSGRADMQRVLELAVEYLRELRGMLDLFVVKQMARFRPELQRAFGMLPDLEMRLAEHAAGRDVILYSAPAAIFVHTPRQTAEPQVDCDAALYAMMIAAQAHGLGTCWNGWLTKAGDAFKARRATGLRRLLAIPDHHDVLAAMTIGYPALRLHSIPQRETAIHWIATSG